MRTKELMADGVPSFVIKSITAAKCNGLGVDTPDVTVVVVLPNELFKRLQSKGDLGYLVLDVNNEVYSINPNIPSHNPTVGGIRDRAYKGIKRLEFVYRIRDLNTAKALGIPVHEFQSGWAAKYGEYTNLLDKPKAQLKVVR